MRMPVLDTCKFADRLTDLRALPIAVESFDLPDQKKCGPSAGSTVDSPAFEADRVADAEPYIKHQQDSRARLLALNARACGLSSSSRSHASRIVVLAKSDLIG